MNEKNKNLVLRAVSALSLLPVVVFLLYMGGLYTTLLLGVASAICVSEYYLITQKELSPAAWVGIVLAGALPFLALRHPERTGEGAFWVLAFFLIFAFTYHLIRGPLQDAPTRVAHLVTGFLYGSVGLTAMCALRQMPEGLMWVIAALVITWANDTVAYFAGRFLGRHKLYPAVSPNKTWEGFAGGLVGSVVGMFITRAGFFPLLTVTDCVFLGICGGILGPIGDLCESMLKRAYGVKDSGRAMPGHGGILDRIDALVFNAPLVFVYVTFLRGVLP
ncbi:phosphatidate cytidylyltransferase [Cystobacter fuscus]|uniref:Phosphatidate cytidylyltransferase n=1 Tax=Cystobacter fuscus TaxID=43 RepID=A0A250J0B4_9BACT|nr:phosphatidate cytidylyltransferase [Cystobacter fuscus]ATB37415.1 phosphatidate cytidylyltransferase [Cystobacter fuscus]